MDPTPTRHDRISQRAYEIFDARGRQHGHDLDDWLQAESEINRTYTGAVESPLSSYGRPLVSYSGHGTVTWGDGTSSALNFDAAQFPDGQIVVVGRYERDDAQFWFGGGDDLEPISFTGTTRDGWSLRSEGPVRSTNYLPKMTAAGSYDAFRLNHLKCFREATSPVTQHRFGLVNFDFEGTVSVTIERPRGRSYTQGLPVTLSVGDRTVAGVIVAVDDSNHLHRHVITHKSAEVLAELVVPKTEGIEGADLVEAVNDLGVVLSVMRGTKIVWIYRHDYSQNQIVHTTHRSSIVKAYSPWAPIRGDYEHRAASAAFIPKALEALANSPVLKADRAVVDAYLDAKVEHDFLETRAGKVALAIEKLKHTFLRSGAAEVDEYVVPDATFRPLAADIVKAIRPVLEHAGIPESKAALIASEGKIRGLNRTAFRGILKGLCRHASLTVPSREIELFIMCRNYLVHTGQFYCQGATDEDRAKVPPHATALEEFCFLISFLDRVFLKLFGYSGEYFDWRDFPNHRKLRTL